MHSYYQEHYLLDEERDLRISDDAVYRFTINGRFSHYVEEGYVVANNSQITFVATSVVDPGSTLARGHAARYWIAKDDAGFPEFHLLFPEHDGYGGDAGDDIYYIQ